MMYGLRQLRKTKELPPGHIDKKRAEIAAEKEYEKCKVVEYLWWKRFKKFPRLNLHQALEFSNKLCDTLGQRKLKKIVICSPEVDEFAGAHYSNGSIHFKWDFIYFSSLIHELTHHFGEGGHGDSFCKMEDFLFQVAYTLIKGKQPKKGWT